MKRKKEENMRRKKEGEEEEGYEEERGRERERERDKATSRMFYKQSFIVEKVKYKMSKRKIVKINENTTIGLRTINPFSNNFYFHFHNPGGKMFSFPFPSHSGLCLLFSNSRLYYQKIPKHLSFLFLSSPFSFLLPLSSLF